MKYLFVFLIVGLSGCWESTDQRHEQKIEELQTLANYTYKELRSYQAKDWESVCNRYFKSRNPNSEGGQTEVLFHESLYFELDHTIYCRETGNKYMDGYLTLSEARLALELLDKCNLDCKMEGN